MWRQSAEAVWQQLAEAAVQRQRGVSQSPAERMEVGISHSQLTRQREATKDEGVSSRGR